MKERELSILVATRNEDKFEIVRRLIQPFIGGSLLISLNSTKIDGDVVESGSINERAIQKALYFHERSQAYGRKGQHFATLAADDGFAVDI